MLFFFFINQKLSDLHRSLLTNWSQVRILHDPPFPNLVQSRFIDNFYLVLSCVVRIVFVVIIGFDVFGFPFVIPHGQVDHQRENVLLVLVPRI